MVPREAPWTMGLGAAGFRIQAHIQGCQFEPMLFPVRCFSCSKYVLPYYRPYARRASEGEDPGNVLDSVDIRRPCCRRMFITHVTTLETHTLGCRASFEGLEGGYVKTKTEYSKPVHYESIL